MTIWFTADTHLGHANIIASCKRPFANVDLMDACLISNWNASVNNSDTVYHLGDFLWRSDKIWMLDRLHGKIILIAGNHDSQKIRKLTRFEAVHDYLEINHNGKNIVMCHYPFSTWNHAHKGAVNLHGHSHGNHKPNGLQYDVGVDCWNYKPITLPDILERYAPVYRPVDHHGAKK